MATTNLLFDATLTSTDTCNSTSWTSLAGCTTGNLSIAGTSSVVLLTFSATLEDGTTDSAAHFRFVVDGSPPTGSPVMGCYNDNTDAGSSVTMIYAVDGLSAGTHTFGVEWLGTQATPTIETAGNCAERHFQVIEFQGSVNLRVDQSSTVSDTDSASWSDITDMTGTFTPTGSSLCMVLFNMMPNGSTDDSASIRLNIGGSQDGPMGFVWTDATNEESSICLPFVVENLAASSTTFKVQWLNEQGTVTSADTARTFQVIEFTDSTEWNLGIDQQLTAVATAPTASYADITSFTGSITPDSTSSVMLMLGGLAQSNSGDGDEAYVARFEIGTTQVGAEIMGWKDGNSNINTTSLAFASDNESGSTDFAWQWLQVSGNVQSDVNYMRTFQVIDFIDVSGSGGTTIEVPTGPWY